MQPYSVFVKETIVRYRVVNVVVPDDKDNSYAEELVKANPPEMNDSNMTTTLNFSACYGHYDEV
jgi:hypothetical protein